MSELNTWEKIYNAQRKSQKAANNAAIKIIESGYSNSSQWKKFFNVQNIEEAVPNFINIPKKPIFTFTGEYVVSPNNRAKVSPVYDVSVYYNNSLIYIIGFSKEQTEGAPYCQLDDVLLFLKHLEKIKKLAKKYMIQQNIIF